MSKEDFGPGRSAGTVYDGPPLAPLVKNESGPAVATSRSQPGVPGGIRTRVNKAAATFYVIAALTAANAVVVLVSGLRFEFVVGTPALAGTDLRTVLIANSIASGVLVLLGLFAQKGSKAAVILGILLYAGDLVVQFKYNPVVSPISIIVHGFILWTLVQGYRELPA